MNKKICKIIITVIVILVFIVGVMYLIDLDKMKKGEPIVILNDGNLTGDDAKEIIEFIKTINIVKI